MMGETDWVNVGDTVVADIQRAVFGEAALLRLGSGGVASALESCLPEPAPRPDGLACGPGGNQRLVPCAPVRLVVPFRGKRGRIVKLALAAQWTHAARSWHPSARNARGWWDVLRCEGLAHA
jgi:hypothetical protein